MPAKHHDLHGNAPDSSSLALVLIDVINDMSFEGGERLAEHARPAAERIAALKRRAKELGVPVIYANDNFGRWQSNLHDVVEHALHEDAPGREIAERLRPESDDYFVLKPKHSAFFATTFELLLEYLQVKRLILTGFTGDICVLLTACDAYMRDYQLHVPRDCLASAAPEENDRALAYMERVLDADTTPSTRLDLRGSPGDEG